MDLTKTPSWPEAAAAKDAWDAIRMTDILEDQKNPVRNAYVQATEKCMREAGLL